MATLATNIYITPVLLLCAECKQPIRATITTAQWIKVEYIGPDGQCRNCHKQLKEQRDRATTKVVSETCPVSPFKAKTGMLGATETGQRVTVENVHHLPTGSVVRLDDTDGVLVHLHDDLWYYRNGCAWCYDKIEHLSRYLPGTLCHHP